MASAERYNLLCGTAPTNPYSVGLVPDRVPYEKTFVENMTRARKAAGMTQTELARRAAEHGLPFHQPTIQRIEAGERPVRVNEAVVLSEILRMNFMEALTPSTPETAARTLEAQIVIALREAFRLQLRSKELAEVCEALRHGVQIEFDTYRRSLEAMEAEPVPALTEIAEQLIDGLDETRRVLYDAEESLADRLEQWTDGQHPEAR